MLSLHYKGYDVWGHAIEQQGEIMEPHRYAASGTVTRTGKLVAASDVLGIIDDEEEAQRLGVDWARAWIDSHG